MQITSHFVPHPTKSIHSLFDLFSKKSRLKLLQMEERSVEMKIRPLPEEVADAYKACELSEEFAGYEQ